MINLKLWWESLDSKVSFQWKRTLLEVNACSKTFLQDIFVVSKKVYIKLILSQGLLRQICFKNIKVVKGKTLLFSKGSHNQPDHQPFSFTTFTSNVLHVDVAFFSDVKTKFCCCNWNVNDLFQKERLLFHPFGFRLLCNFCFETPPESCLFSSSLGEY